MQDLSSDNVTSSLDTLWKSRDITPAVFLALGGTSSDLPARRRLDVRLESSDGGATNWGLVAVRKGQHVVISRIKDDGLLASWNAANPDMTAGVGDGIVTVNDEDDVDKFLDILSIDTPALHMVIEQKEDCFTRMAAGGRDWQLAGRTPLAPALNDASLSGNWWPMLEAVASESSGCDAAIGCMVGLALGDALGAPLEFVSVVPWPHDCGGSGFQWSPEERPCLLPDFEEGLPQYSNAYNRFGMEVGQWTDDCSMALCLADSLLAHGDYRGGDLRLRWHMWWFHGCCNAFQHDALRPDCASVGLGGNLGQSLQEINHLAEGSEISWESVPPVYAAGGEDAGNGSIMRIAPIPIFYRKDLGKAVDVAAQQSRASHPGDEAAACSQFMAYFIVRALAAHNECRDPAIDRQGFVTDVVDTFLSVYCCDDEGLAGGSKGITRLRALLQCSPPGPEEANWNWKSAELPIQDAITARRATEDGEYNGHPVIPTYFGAYCMDGLAMALWAVWNADDFGTCLRLAINLLGDADTTAAIAGQLAGAIFGYRRILDDTVGAACVRNLQRWDPCAEIGLRAALLYHYSF